MKMNESWRSIEGATEQNTHQSEDKSDLIKIGSLWKHQNKDGKTFLSGSMGEAGCMVFLNKYKEEGKNHPDYNIYVAKKKKKERAGDVPF
jgi:hypothetical protein